MVFGVRERGVVCAVGSFVWGVRDVLGGLRSGEVMSFSFFWGKVWGLCGWGLGD